MQVILPVDVNALLLYATFPTVEFLWCRRFFLVCYLLLRCSSAIPVEVSVLIFLLGNQPEKDQSRLESQRHVVDVPKHPAREYYKVQITLHSRRPG